MRTVCWRGDFAGEQWWLSGTLRSQPARQADGLLAFGEHAAPGLEFAWQLSASPGLAVQKFDVRVVGRQPDGVRLNRTLLLERGADGWQSRAWCCDDVDLPVPGLGAGEAATAADVVLDGCPLSHVPAVRRMGLAGRGYDRRSGLRPLAGTLPVLRVQVPSLAVTLTRHRYTWAGDTDRGRILTHSLARAEPTRMVLDEHGVPLEFGGLRRAADTALAA